MSGKRAVPEQHFDDFDAFVEAVSARTTELNPLVWVTAGRSRLGEPLALEPLDTLDVRITDEYGGPRVYTLRTKKLDGGWGPTGQLSWMTPKVGRRMNPGAAPASSPAGGGVGAGLVTEVAAAVRGNAVQPQDPIDAARRAIALASEARKELGLGAPAATAEPAKPKTLREMIDEAREATQLLKMTEGGADDALTYINVIAPHVKGLASELKELVGGFFFDKKDARELDAKKLDLVARKLALEERKLELYAQQMQQQRSSPAAPAPAEDKPAATTTSTVPPVPSPAAAGDAADDNQEDDDDD